MAWVCRFCSTSNADTDTKCMVCDTAKPSGGRCTLTKKRVADLGLKGNITIPVEFNAIGEGAFKDRSDITGLCIHTGIEVIEKEAFMNCKNLASVICVHKLESIKGKAFYGCSSLPADTRPLAKRVADDAFSLPEPSDDTDFFEPIPRPSHTPVSTSALPPIGKSSYTPTPTPIIPPKSTVTEPTIGTVIPPSGRATPTPVSTTYVPPSRRTPIIERGSTGTSRSRTHSDTASTKKGFFKTAFKAIANTCSKLLEWMRSLGGGLFTLTLITLILILLIPVLGVLAAVLDLSIFNKILASVIALYLGGLLTSLQYHIDDMTTYYSYYIMPIINGLLTILNAVFFFVFGSWYLPFVIMVGASLIISTAFTVYAAYDDDETAWCVVSLIIAILNIAMIVWAIVH